ncbi:MAG TPA: flagellar hook-length control protein FliK [Cellvibrio sp.]|nr:flagellar hook-length control protein FliK [Cellvibrio sp.]
MDISSLTQNLIKGLAQKNNTELAALSRALDIALGKVTTATVTEITPVSAQERQELLKKTAEALQQLSKLPQTSPAAKQEISRLLEQQTLIKSPDLKWVSLLVNNRQQLTYSDKPLVAGQTVTVQLATAQKLVLLDLPDTEGAARPATPDKSPIASPTYAAKPASLPGTLAATAPTTQTTATIATKIIADDRPESEETPANKELSKNDIAIKNSPAPTSAATAKIQMATVTETAPMSEDERQELFKKTSEELLKLNKMASATSQAIPGLKEAITSLQQQQALIKSPATQWIHLTTGNQSLLTYSDKPLAAGQAVAVQVQTPQKIALLDLPESNQQTDTLENKLKALAEALSSGQKIPLPTYFSKFSLPAMSSEQKAIPTAIPEENTGQTITHKTPASLAATAPPTKIQMATVTETLPIAPQERQELLSKTSEELLKLNKMASASSQVIPGLKEAISSLLQQQALIKSPDTKWIHLSAENQSLLTYSNKPLATGQTIPVQIVTPQKIVLLDLPESANTVKTAETVGKEPEHHDSRLKALTENLNAALATQRNAIPTYFSKFSLPENSIGQRALSESKAAQGSEQNLAVKSSNITTATTAAKIQQASVTETAPLSDPERRELLKNITQEIAQLNKLTSSKSPASPELKEAIAQLSQQQALIKSPETKWVHLRVNSQTLLTYSDKPLAAGQSLPVQIITPQKIILLEQPETIDQPSQPTIKPAEGQSIKQPGNQESSSPGKAIANQTVSTGVAADITETAVKAPNENISRIQKNSLPTYFAKLTSADQPAIPQETPDPAIAKPDTTTLKPETTTAKPETTTGKAEATIAKAEIAGKTTVPTAASAMTAASNSTSIQTATVVKTLEVSPQQRQELLIKIAAELVQVNKLANSSAPSIPSVKEVVSSLLEQQELIKSPNLKWLELSLNNKSLTTYSEKTVQPGQAIPVQIVSAQKIVLLDSVDTAIAEKPATAPESKGSLENAISDKVATQTEPNVKTEEVDSTLASARQWQNISSVREQLLAPKTLEQALKRVAEQIRTHLQLTQPNNIASAKTTDGEAKTTPIAQQPLSTANKVNAPALTSVNSESDAAEAKVLLQEIEQRLNGSNKPISIALTAKILERLITPDGTQKPAASQPSADQAAPRQATASPAIAERAPANPAAANIPGAQLQANTSHLDTPEDQAVAIKLLIQQLLNKPGNDIPNKEAREQLIKLMQLPAENFEKMDISKLTQHLLKGLEQNNKTEVAALSRTLNITLGKPVMAKVNETAAVTPQERKELLAKTTEALTQLNKLASNPAQATPAVKAEVLRLLEQQALIKSPDLKWVNLSVNNNSLLTYTDKSLTAGQAVPVQLVNQQKLVLLDSVAENSASNTAKNSQNIQTNPAAGNSLGKAITTPLAEELLGKLTGGATKPQVNELLKNQPAVTPSATHYKLNTPEIKQIVADRLRQLLPYKDTPSALFSAVNQWQQIPAPLKQPLVSANLEQALKSVAEKIRSPLQLSQPKVLETIIKNSGIFFENNLNNNQTSKGPSLDNIFSQDTKGSLLNLLSRVNQELSGSSKPLSTEQATRLLQQLSSYTPSPAAYSAAGSAGDLTRNTLAPDISMLMQQLMTKSVKHMSDKELRTQLLVLMQQHSLHSIAKIQMQQLASLNHELDSRDSTQPNASWQVEIPIRHHSEVQPLHIRIDREWVEEKGAGEQSQNSSNKVKQWSVTLRFDLPTLGEFCAQLSIIDTSVSVTLWASQEKTFGQVKKQMDDLRNNLEKEGIQVKQLQCMKGMPAQKPMALSYSLIDIST